MTLPHRLLQPGEHDRDLKTVHQGEQWRGEWQGREQVQREFVVRHLVGEVYVRQNLLVKLTQASLRQWSVVH